MALYLLGALDDRKHLTDLGRRMAFFPLEPALSRAVLASVEFGCTSEVLAIVSVLSASSKLDVNATTQAQVFARLQSLPLTCLD